MPSDVAEHFEMQLRWSGTKTRSPARFSILRADDCDLTSRSLGYACSKRRICIGAARTFSNRTKCWSAATPTMQSFGPYTTLRFARKFASLLVDGSLFYRSADGTKRWSFWRK